MAQQEEITQFANAEILIQTINAQICDEDYRGSSNNDGFSNTRITDNIAKFIRNSKKNVTDKVKREILTLAEAYGTALKEIPNQPDEFELGLSFSISTKGDVCIVSSESQAMMKVTMKWKK